MELTQVVVSMVGLALVGVGKLTRDWSDARATRSLAVARMHRYGGPRMTVPHRFTAL